MVATTTSAANVALVSSVDNNLPFIRADDRRMRQILFNLISNAVKFTPEGGRVQVAARMSGDEVLVKARVEAAIVGGAVIPLLMGFVADRIGLTPAFLVPLVCYAYIVHYGLRGHIPRKA